MKMGGGDLKTPPTKPYLRKTLGTLTVPRQKDISGRDSQSHTVWGMIWGMMYARVRVRVWADPAGMYGSSPARGVDEHRTAAAAAATGRTPDVSNRKSILIPRRQPGGPKLLVLPAYHPYPLALPVHVSSFPLLVVCVLYYARVRHPTTPPTDASHGPRLFVHHVDAPHRLATVAVESSLAFTAGVSNLYGPSSDFSNCSPPPSRAGVAKRTGVRVRVPVRIKTICKSTSNNHESEGVT